MKQLNSILLCLVFSMGAIAQKTAPLAVKVTDFDEQPRPGEQILFVGESSGITKRGIADEEGKFTVDLPEGDVYEIKIKTVGEADDYNKIEIPKLQPGQQFGRMTVNILIEDPKMIRLDNVYFSTGKSTLRRESYEELDEFYEYLRRKDDLSIEIAGHTDNVGDDASNMKLSQARAETVRDYLISKGISASRLTAKGYGESQPVADNGTTEGRAQNRRTEVRIK